MSKLIIGLLMILLFIILILLFWIIVLSAALLIFGRKGKKGEVLTQKQGVV